MVSFQQAVPGTQQAPTGGEPDYSTEVNISMPERVGMAAAGGILALRAIWRPSLTSLLLGAGGGWLIYRSMTGHCPVYENLGINTAREGAAQPHEYFHNGIHVETAYTIARSPQELYTFWRNFENLPRFLSHVQAVRKLDEKRSHWVVSGPAGRDLEWDAEIINEEPNRLIAWRSTANTDVHNAGSVWFVPSSEAGRTQVRVVMEYIPPAGKIGSAINWLFGESPRKQIEDDLLRFKTMMEMGVPTKLSKEQPAAPKQ